MIVSYVFLSMLIFQMKDKRVAKKGEEQRKNTKKTKYIN